MKNTGVFKFLSLGVLALVTALLLQVTVLAQEVSTEVPQENRPEVKTLYVERFGNSEKAFSFKDHLEGYLQEYGFLLTRNRYQADAVVTGVYKGAYEQASLAADRSPSSVLRAPEFTAKNASNPGIKISALVQKPHQDETLWSFSSRGFFNKRLAKKMAKEMRSAL